MTNSKLKLITSRSVSLKHGTLVFQVIEPRGKNSELSIQVYDSGNLKVRNTENGKTSFKILEQDTGERRLYAELAEVLKERYEQENGCPV